MHPSLVCKIIKDMCALQSFKSKISAVQMNKLKPKPTMTLMSMVNVHNLLTKIVLPHITFSFCSCDAFIQHRLDKVAVALLAIGEEEVQA